MCLVKELGSWDQICEKKGYWLPHVSPFLPFTLVWRGSLARQKKESFLGLGKPETWYVLWAFSPKLKPLWDGYGHAESTREVAKQHLMLLSNGTV